MSSIKRLISIGAVNGFLAVALGAFGAHGLKRIATPEQLAWFNTASEYQMSHALAILLCGLVAIHINSRYITIAGYLFLAGIVIFSGSLYAMALGAPRWLGAVTPIGGTAFLLAWAILAWSALRSWNRPHS